jgi:hypothetical protein
MCYSFYIGNAVLEALVKDSPWKIQTGMTMLKSFEGPFDRALHFLYKRLSIKSSTLGLSDLIQVSHSLEERP